MDDDVRYINIHGVCARYDIKRRTVWRWVKAKILPPPQYINGPASGARWRVSKLDELDAQREQAA